MLSRFALVVPVKPPVVGKSRLRGLPDRDRRRLAEAFALDTVAACLAAEPAGVLVSTDDATLAARFTALGCVTVPDGDTCDLNSTLTQAAAEAVRRWPGTGTTLYAAPRPVFAPRFGPDSRAAHQRSGATELAGDLAGLRRDVDDVADLRDAMTLGVGAHTRDLPLDRLVGSREGRAG